jgi:hypothetical protein
VSPPDERVQDVLGPDLAWSGRCGERRVVGRVPRRAGRGSWVGGLCAPRRDEPARAGPECVGVAEWRSTATYAPACRSPSTPRGGLGRAANDRPQRTDAARAKQSSGVRTAGAPCSPGQGTAGGAGRAQATIATARGFADRTTALLVAPPDRRDPAQTHLLATLAVVVGPSGLMPLTTDRAVAVKLGPCPRVPAVTIDVVPAGELSPWGIS